MSMSKHTQASVAWGMWKARQKLNAQRHADAVQRYTALVTECRPDLTVLSVSERHINLQCNSCGARLYYSTRQVKRLATRPDTSVVCKSCAPSARHTRQPSPMPRLSPDRATLCSRYAVLDGVLVYNDHSSPRLNGTPFGTPRWVKKERRERRYGLVKGYGYFYADELISIMEGVDAQEKTQGSQDNS